MLDKQVNLIYNPRYQETLYFIKLEGENIKGIKTRRIAAGLSQKQLAEKLAVTQAAIANWETGVAYPRASQLPALAEALHCSIDELYTPPKESA